MLHIAHWAMQIMKQLRAFYGWNSIMVFDVINSERESAFMDPSRAIIWEKSPQYFLLSLPQVIQSCHGDVSACIYSLLMYSNLLCIPLPFRNSRLFIFLYLIFLVFLYETAYLCKQCHEEYLLSSFHIGRRGRGRPKL